MNTNAKALRRKEMTVDEDTISNVIIASAIEVHRELGPGLLESIYRKCLARELSLRDVAFCEEVPMSASYKGLAFEAAYRLDILVADKVIIELKAVENLLPVHHAQLLSYLRLTGKKLGLLINFNVPILKIRHQKSRQQPLAFCASQRLCVGC